RAFPPTLPACCRSSSPDPETSFPAAHTKATLLESWQTDSDTPTPAPPVTPLPPTRPPDVSPSAATGSPLPPIPQSPPVSSSPSHLLTETALPSRILNQRFYALYRRRRSIGRQRCSFELSRPDLRKSNAGGGTGASPVQGCVGTARPREPVLSDAEWVQAERSSAVACNS